jgi:hypothetical protein
MSTRFQTGVKNFEVENCWFSTDLDLLYEWMDGWMYEWMDVWE